MPTVEDDSRVIVIGSGPTGAMAALTLTQYGIPVTLLESGQRMPEGALVRAMGRTLYRKWPHPPADWLQTFSDDPKALWFHQLVPGGLTNYWTGAVPRFAPEDFTDGARLHARYRWPVSYDDLRPYYARVERLLFISGATRDLPTLPAADVAYPCSLPPDWRRIAPFAEALGQGLIPMPLAMGKPWMVSRRGAPFNSFAVIVAQLQRKPNFELLLGAHALRLEWSGDKRRVTSVVYFDRATHSERRINAAAVVVAASPLSSTKLLLDSACADFPEGLGNTEGILGKYLHDHPRNWCVVELDRPLSRLSHMAHLTRAAYRDSDPLRAASCTLGKVTNLDRVLALLPTKTHQFGVVTFSTMIPLESNQITLHATQKDEFGLPRLDVHIRFDDAAQPGIDNALKRMVSVLDAAGIGATIQGKTDYELPGASVHYGGSVRMHESPAYGMLDGWNRLHAVPNVIVADASSFTTGVEKNPTLTAMALAARAAERLAKDLKTF